jgi:hypothetical protein
MATIVEAIMSHACPRQRQIAAPPPPEQGQTLSKRATVVWLLQLIFPTISLAHVGFWLREGFDFGRLDLVLLVLGGLWYVGALVVLALPGGRRWIATHPVQLMALYLCSTVGLVAAEVVCRSLPLPYDPRLPHITEFSPQLGWRPIAGANGIGEHGWRLPYYPHEKSPNRFRIACLGDSTTFGIGCSWKDAWPHQLEVFLNQDVDWSKSYGITEALNFGFSSYGPDHALLVLKQYALAYSPDLILFHLTIDDFADASFDHQWQMNYGSTWYKPFYFLKDGRLVLGRDVVPLPRGASGDILRSVDQSGNDFQLYLFSFLRSQGRFLFDQEPPTKVPEPTNTHWPIHESFRTEYREARPLVWALIQEMSRVSREAGAVFLVTLSPCHMPGAADNPPWRVAQFLQEYQEDAQKAGVLALHGVPEYFAEGGNDRFLVSHTTHLNPKGNALIARMTGRWLKEAYARPAPAVP